MKKIIEYCNQKPKWLLRILGVVLVGVIGYIDYLTGDYSMTLFYLGPVFLGAWFVNKWAGFVMCFLSGVAIVVAHEIPHSVTYNPIVLHTWNTLRIPMIATG